LFLWRRAVLELLTNLSEENLAKRIAVDSIVEPARDVGRACEYVATARPRMGSSSVRMLSRALGNGFSEVNDLE
jgi:hypothetical protein